MSFTQHASAPSRVCRLGVAGLGSPPEAPGGAPSCSCSVSGSGLQSLPLSSCGLSLKSASPYPPLPRTCLILKSHPCLRAGPPDLPSHHPVGASWGFEGNGCPSTAFSSLLTPAPNSLTPLSPPPHSRSAPRVPDLSLASVLSPPWCPQDGPALPGGVWAGHCACVCRGGPARSQAHYGQPLPCSCPPVLSLSPGFPHHPGPWPQLSLFRQEHGRPQLALGPSGMAQTLWVTALVSTPVFSSLHIRTTGVGPRVCAQHPASMEGAAALVWEGVRE